MPYKAQIQATLGGGAAQTLAEYLAALNNYSPLAIWDAGAGVYSDAGTTPAADGAGVQQFVDQVSGKVFAQATAANKLTYRASVAALNNRPALQNDGDDYMLLALSGGILSAAGNTYNAIAVYTTTNGDQGVLYSEGNNTLTQPNIFLDKEGNERARLVHRDDANTTALTQSGNDTVPTDGTMVLQTGRRTGAAAWAVRVDETEVGTNNVTSAGTTTITHICFGARYNAGAISANHIGHIGGLYLFGNLSAPVLAQIEAIIDAWYRPA